MLKYFKYSYQKYFLPLQPVTLLNLVRCHPQDLLPLPEGLGLGFLKTGFKKNTPNLNQLEELIFVQLSKLKSLTCHYTLFKYNNSGKVIREFLAMGKRLILTFRVD